MISVLSINSLLYPICFVFNYFNRYPLPSNNLPQNMSGRTYFVIILGMGKYKSTKHYILEALIPFSEPNMKLAFKPKLFFNDLDRLHAATEKAARNAFHRARKEGLIEVDDQGIPRLTNKGLNALQPFQAKQFSGGQLMVIFDIPESERWKRRQLRATLREFSFKQIQQSVWISDLDCAEYIKDQVKNLNLSKNVRIYEASPL